MAAKGQIFFMYVNQKQIQQMECTIPCDSSCFMLSQIEQIFKNIKPRHSLNFVLSYVH